MLEAQVVVGCGNLLASDDGVGIHVVRELLSRRLPPAVKVIEAGVPGLRLLDLIRDTQRAIIVDAVVAGERPGTVLRFNGSQLPRHARIGCSLHGMDLLYTLNLGWRLEPERMPKEIIIIGIQVERQAPWRTELSPSVAAAVPKAVEAVMAEISNCPSAD
ncbi:hydrogenase maturation protease [Calderihabitans maritimus]|uniref:Coenzyme F420-nonreducing hydrogenase, subunit D maturation factor n=1 Tax=Calderihabitans maritimus TaxID=1246530 RepID=A0A1Z5HVE8_9FIRM|nr:hydrogenase maturation protease [Calderihabitans maritimus]GAW93260.1 coenzyme F420-nonreducing hydrogenase, subunit D maturation factor [Calderihabitans maritimus]